MWTMRGWHTERAVMLSLGYVIFLLYYLHLVQDYIFLKVSKTENISMYIYSKTYLVCTPDYSNSGCSNFGVTL